MTRLAALSTAFALWWMLGPAHAAGDLPPQGLSPGGTITYTPELHDAVKRSDRPYVLDFHATWCGTCRAQTRQIERLRSEDDRYSAITVLKVNWDAYRTEPVARDLGIPRRSTLVLLRGEREIDRIVAATQLEAIKALFDQGLAAGQR